MELDEGERALLDVERTWWMDAGSKESIIRDRLGMSPSSYSRQLQTLINSPTAAAYDPLVVRRLVRARNDRQRARTENCQIISPRRR